MGLESETFEILAQRALTHADSEKLVDWAIKIIELGYESENLYFLAGLSFGTTEEREKYFEKSLKDLNLTIEYSKEYLLSEYALLIANKAVSKEIDIDYAFNQMLRIVSASGYDSRYIPFFDIEEALDYLSHDQSPLFQSELTSENSKEFILDEMEIFIQMETMKIPLRDREKCLCQTCNRLNFPTMKTKYQFKRPFKYAVWCCSLCDSKRLLFCSTHKVKRLIIEEFRVKQN